MTTIGTVGLGLIGGSIALAAARAGHPVVAWDPDPETCEQARQLGLTITEDFSDAELIVLASPMPALTEGLTATLASVRVSDTALITDVGSVKQPVAEAMRSAGLAQRYIGGHPMAGSERTGFTAATPDLFTGARWVLCLHDDNSDGNADDADEVRRWLHVAALITDLGAGVVPMSAAEHDAATALVSGVPHLLALALARAAEVSGPAIQTLAAGSFTDLTRVASSSPTLLHAVTEGNAPALRSALRLVLNQLDQPWPDLIEHGHAARHRALDRSGGGQPPGGCETVTVSGARGLLELGRAGAVIETVDPIAGVVGYRRPAPGQP
jgi:prephenate dehydrogenase